MDESEEDKWFINRRSRHVLQCRSEFDLICQLPYMLDKNKGNAVQVFEDPLIGFILLACECSTCHKWNVFSGICHGITTATKHVAYSLELMCCWLVTSSLLSTSYRTFFTWSRLISRSEGARLRFTCGKVFQMDDGGRANRRVANEAFRNFLAKIDINKSESTDLHFSCKQCERALGDREAVDIGLDLVSDAGTWRLKTLVIDRNAAGILKPRPTLSDEATTLADGKPDTEHVISNHETKNAVKYFIRLYRVDLKLYGCAPSERHDNFFMRDRKMVVRLNAVQNSEHSRKTGRSVLKRLISIIK